MFNKLKKKYFDLRNLLQDYYLLEIKDKRSSLSDKEKYLIKEFRDEVKQISIKNIDSSWNDFSKKLRFYVKHFDPRNFLRWSFISLTMTTSSDESFKILKKSSGWSNCWRIGTKESSFGNPVISESLEGSSGTLVAHNYHIYKLKESANVNLNNIDSVVEFGGGYGSMCRLFRQLGFKGEYVIYDLPEFSFLQKFFLKGIGLSVMGKDDQMKQDGQNILVNKTQDLGLVLKKLNTKKKLFIATWSLSETPIDLRDKILNMVDSFDYYLIGFQGNFDGIDNKEYFRHFSEKIKNITWSLEKIDFWNGYYLIGRKIYEK